MNEPIRVVRVQQGDDLDKIIGSVISQSKYITVRVNFSGAITSPCFSDEAESSCTFEKGTPAETIENWIRDMYQAVSETTLGK